MTMTAKRMLRWRFTNRIHSRQGAALVFLMEVGLSAPNDHHDDYDHNDDNDHDHDDDNDHDHDDDDDNEYDDDDDNQNDDDDQGTWK